MWEKGVEQHERQIILVQPGLRALLPDRERQMIPLSIHVPLSIDLENFASAVGSDSQYLDTCPLVF